MKFSLFSPNVRAVNSFLAQKSQKRRFNVNLSLSIAVMHLAVQAISLASLKFERKKTNISNKRNIVIKKSQLEGGRTIGYLRSSNFGFSTRSLRFSPIHKFDIVACW